MMKKNILIKKTGMIFIISLALLSFQQSSAATAEDKHQQGVSAKCFNKEYRPDIAPCLDTKLAELNQKLALLHSELSKQYIKLNPPGISVAIKSLDNAQKSFFKFRRDECKRIGDAAFGGSGAGDLERACEVDLTYWYINKLKASDISSD